MGQLNQEPSMEDILASIKRIIAEDSEAAPVRAPRVRKGPVAVPDPGPDPEIVDGLPDSVSAPVAAEIAPVPEPAQDAPAETVPEEEFMPDSAFHAEPAVEDTADVLELTSPIPEPAPAAAARATAAAAPASPIISGPAEAASRTAFAALSQLQVRSEGNGDNTLEGLVTEMLRPMLREWLDRELPGVVERLVAAEIQRVSGRG